MANTILTINGTPWTIMKVELEEILKKAKTKDTVIIYKTYIWEILVKPDSDFNNLKNELNGLLSKQREKYIHIKPTDSNETIDPSPFFNHINSIDNTDFSDIIVLIEWFEKYFELQGLTRNIDKTNVVEKIIETIEKFWYEFNYSPKKEIEDLDWNDPEVIKFTIWHLLESLKNEWGIIRNPLLHQLSNLKESLKNP